MFVFIDKIALLSRLRVTEGDKLRLKKAGKDFIDVTDHPHLGQLNAQRIRTSSIHGSLLTNDITPKAFIREMFDDKIDDSHLRRDIANLTSFWNRSYRSSYGLKSSNWVYDTVSEVCEFHEEHYCF